MATWQLDPHVTHMNHGSFGACPVEVLDVQQRFRTDMEHNPMSFMLHTYQPALEESRTAVADFVHADRDGLVFVPNATAGVNAVLRSLEAVLLAGGEILMTDHGYNACRNAADVAVRRFGGSITVAAVPFPVEDPAQIVDSVMACVNERTALVMLDHVTSSTGIVVPVDELVARLEPQIPVLVDGAHAPGMIEVDIGSLGASFYAANCHKWMCAPKGAAFLHVAERHRPIMHASTISHGYNNGWPNSGTRFHAQFDWIGTDDPSARLSVAASLQTMEQHRSDGWPGIRRSNHELVLQGREIIADALGVALPAPASMIGAIASVAVPGAVGEFAGIFDPLMYALHDTWGIEVPVFAWPDSERRLLRVSAQQYNNVADFERLAAALVAELGTG